jgi:hypothetical protein
MKGKIFLILFWMGAGLSFGQGDWKAAPLYFIMNASQGDTLQGSFSVSNHSDENKQFRIYQRDWIFTEEGKEQEIEPGNYHRGCSGWIAVAPLNFTVGPNQSQEVRYTMVVPQVHEAGSYWSAIYVEPADKPRLASQVSGEGRTMSLFLQIRATISIVTTIKGQIEKKGENTSIEAAYDPLKQQLRVASVFNNNGNLLVEGKGRVEIRDQYGEPVVTFPLQKFISLPGHKRMVLMEKESNLSKGEYSALVVIDFGGDYLVAGEAFFDVL